MSFKIFPRINVVDFVSVTGIGGSYESASMPVTNVQNADLSRVARLTVPGRFAGGCFLEVNHSGYQLDNEGLCLAGLEFNTSGSSVPQVRIRQDDEPYVLQRVRVPTSIDSETRATHTLSDLQEDPDAFGGTWPTFTGSAGQSSILRVDVPHFVGTLGSNADDLPGGGHPVRFRVGIDASAGSCTVVVRYYEGGVLQSALSHQLDSTNAADQRIADGGVGGTAWIPPSAITTSSSAQIEIEATGSGGHALTAAARVYWDIAPQYDSGFVDLYPAGWDSSLYPRTRGEQFHHIISGGLGTAAGRTRIDFYDSGWAPGDYVDVGRLLLGPAETPTSGWMLDGTSIGARDQSIVVESLGGQALAEERVRRRKAAFQLNHVSEQFRRDWIAYWQQRKGVTGEICVVPDSDDTSNYFFDAIYGRLPTLNDFSVFTQTVTGNFWSLRLDVEELTVD